MTNKIQMSKTKKLTNMYLNHLKFDIDLTFFAQGVSAYGGGFCHLEFLKT